jgi:hypothetical protein
LRGVKHRGGAMSVTDIDNGSSRTIFDEWRLLFTQQHTVVTWKHIFAVKMSRARIGCELVNRENFQTDWSIIWSVGDLSNAD